MNRRHFLLAGLAGATLAARKRDATLLFDRGFAIVPGVYVTIADASKGMQCGSNGGVIAGRSAVPIVEGQRCGSRPPCGTTCTRTPRK